MRGGSPALSTAAAAEAGVEWGTCGGHVQCEPFTIGLMISLIEDRANDIQSSWWPLQNGSKRHGCMALDVTSKPAT